MAVIRKATPEDYDKVLPLFKGFNNENLSSESWKPLFKDNWNSGEGYIGYVLCDGEHICGFIALLFSRRKINGKEEKVCNVSSWVVEEKSRSQSLLLLSQVLKLKDWNITILTCSEETYQIVRKLGFKDLESHFQIILPIPSIGSLFEICKVKLIGDKPATEMQKESIEFWKDHAGFGLISIGVKTLKGHCFVLASRIIRKNLPFIQIHHISDHQEFAKFAGRISACLCFRFKAISILMDRRWLEGMTPAFSISWPLPQPRVFKSDILQATDFDSLYSELPVLNL